MRTTLKQTLATMAALGALLIASNACTDHDDLRNPAGTQLLALGEVNIAGAQTATADTRAAITEDNATGFFGIRKSTFKAGDVLALTLSNGGTDTKVTATLDGTANTWTMDRTYYAAGTTLSATYTPATQPGGIKHKDVLTTDPANPVTLEANGNKQKLTLVHANAMLEITPPAGIKADYTISVKATPTNDPGNPGNPGTAETLATVAEEDAGSVIRYRTIALPGKVTTITLTTTDHSMVYTATLDTELTVEANKRYPIALTLTPDGLTATVNSTAGDLNWGTDNPTNGRPAGYTYYISTPEELAQFAADVNVATATDGAKMVAIQTADIDLSQLKDATGSYTYTATATQWEPIGTSDDGTSKNYFRGKYNGNGHTISNLKITQDTDGYNLLGLFGGATGAKITGVHLRNCTITSTNRTNIRAGALIANSSSSIVTLCSATGSIEVSGNVSWVGGIVGFAGSGPTSNPNNYFTRCSADVAVSRNSSDSGVVGGFAGYSTDTYYAGCIASGKVYKSGGGISSGFSSGNTTPTYHAYHCITNSEIVNGNGDATSAFGNIYFPRHCLATQPSYGDFGTSLTYANSNVALGTLTTNNHAGYITASVPVADVYATLTANNVNGTNVTNYVPIKTLHWSKEDGYTFDVVENKWYALDAWQNNGATALPTLNMAYEGSPEPILPTNKVYMVNGYYVTAPGGETADYTWAASNDATITEMTPDPCAAGASKGWHLPTMKEFEEMLGWEVTRPWSQSATTGALSTIVDAANFIKAFPNDSYYWSSIVHEKNPEGVWAIRANTSTGAYYTSYGKTSEFRVRCVQKQILTR